MGYYLGHKESNALSSEIFDFEKYDTNLSTVWQSFYGFAMNE
jgi:hypothetical protein